MKILNNYGTFFLLIFCLLSSSIFATKKIVTSNNLYESYFFQSSYEQGWEDGFCDGWKEEKGQFSICPVSPISPIPKLECIEGYKCGYIRGLKYGMCRALGGSCSK